MPRFPLVVDRGVKPLLRVATTLEIRANSQREIAAFQLAKVGGIFLRLCRFLARFRIR